MSQEQLWELLLPILSTAVASGLTYLGYIIAKFISMKMAAHQHEELRKRISDLVLAAEQMGGTPEFKFDYVLSNALVFVQQLGLTLTQDQVKTLIEAAVKLMSIQEAATITLPAPAVSPNGTTTTEATITSTTTPDGVG